jgi:hypothetical protein
LGIDLLERDEGALLVRMVQELYVQATRSTRPDPLPHEIAAGLIATSTRFREQEITLSILTGALEIRRRTASLIGTSRSSPPLAPSGAASFTPRT